MATCVVVSPRVNFLKKTLRVELLDEEFPYVHIPEDRMSYTSELFHAREWLADESRPGVFGLLRTSVGYFFAISDPDVAFEFRLRFG